MMGTRQIRQRFLRIIGFAAAGALFATSSCTVLVGENGIDVQFPGGSAFVDDGVIVDFPGGSVVIE